MQFDMRYRTDLIKVAPQDSPLAYETYLLTERLFIGWKGLLTRKLSEP